MFKRPQNRCEYYCKYSARSGVRCQLPAKPTRIHILASRINDPVYQRIYTVLWLRFNKFAQVVLKMNLL